jgi:hypothetical protein
MANESQRLERISFPRTGVVISSLSSNVRQPLAGLPKFNPIGAPCPRRRESSLPPFVRERQI